jgi:predicted acylesterase/phospholipase RssA
LPKGTLNDLYLPLAGIALFMLQIYLVSYIFIQRGVGLLDLYPFREHLNDVLAQKVFKNNGDAIVCFKHLDPLLYPRLKIFATDISAGTLSEFSYERTPDVSVADAVCASICIPLLFKPFRIELIDGHIFVDGGLMANVPAFAFDEEQKKEMKSDVFVVALGGQSEKPPPSTMLGWIRRFVETIVAGANKSDSYMNNQHFRIYLDAEIGTLDFDAAGDIVRSLVDQARIASLLFLNNIEAIKEVTYNLNKAAAEILSQIIAKDINALEIEGRASLGRSNGLTVKIISSYPEDTETAKNSYILSEIFLHRFETVFFNINEIKREQKIDIGYFKNSEWVVAIPILLSNYWSFLPEYGWFFYESSDKELLKNAAHRDLFMRIIEEEIQMVFKEV